MMVGLLFFLATLEPGIFLFEFLDTAGGVDQFLFAGEEGMAGRADFHADLAVHRAHFDFSATGADGFDLMIFRMNIGFHGALLLIFDGLVKSRNAKRSASQKQYIAKLETSSRDKDERDALCLLSETKFERGNIAFLRHS